MSVSRRAILIGGLAMPLLAMQSVIPAFAATGSTLASPLLTTISGVGPDSDLVKLATLVDSFLIQMVPVTLTVIPFAKDGKPLDHNSTLASWLRHYLRFHAGLIEVGIHAETIASSDPYFQLRQISDAQEAFCAIVNEFERFRTGSILRARTVTTRSPAASLQDCSAMRAAGIRTVIRLSRGMEDTAKLLPELGGYWFSDTGLVNTFGSQLSAISFENGATQEVATRCSNILTLAKSGNPIVMDISFPGLEKINEADGARYANELATGIAQAELSNATRNILPQTLYLQSRDKEGRYIIVRIDDFRLSLSADSVHMAFVKDLVNRGYPVTDLVIPAPNEQLLTKDKNSKDYLNTMLANPRFDIATHGWKHTSSELIGLEIQADFDTVRSGVKEMFDATGRFPVSYTPPNNAYDTNTLEAVAATGTLVFSADGGRYQLIAGLDHRGLLHASNTIMSEQSWNENAPYHEMRQMLDLFGKDDDAVFSIHPQTADTPEKRQLIMDTLKALSSQRGTKLVNFAEYYKAVAPSFTKADQIRNARAEVRVRDFQATANDNESALKEDAALAWSYFDWGAKKFHGMVPATSWMENGQQQGYPFTTMWDAGTYILAAVSAHRLGIIDQEKFEKTINTILTFLGASSFRYAGANLPQAERSLASQADQREGFDSADTGRLLISLKILSEYGYGKFPVQRLVASWDFGPVLKNGEMHVVSGKGKLASSQNGSYAGYASRGYNLWGHELKPVFETQDPVRNMDDAVLALAEIQRRGRIATEPHITEEIELGESPHGRLTADILYAAQIKRYRETGIMTCVSEGPVAGVPYFAYQGFQLDDAGGKFVVDLQPSSKATLGDKQRERLRMVSSKASYLWYATRPGDYSEKLIALVRKEGRMAGMGFSSGIFEQSGKRTEVSDLNTNGIILESIAYILGGRKPFLQVKAS